MASETDLKAALDRLRHGLAGLENAIDRRFEQEHNASEADEELRRMLADRSRLAQDLDKSEDRANRLEEANREVSRRLVTSMETIRAVLDR